MLITTAVVALLAILLAPILLIRFRKRSVAAFDLTVTNQVKSRFADRLPGFGILTHVGRKSGRVYRTPVNVFRAPEGFLIALTYGRETDSTPFECGFSKQFAIEAAGLRIRQNSGLRFGIEIADVPAELLLGSYLP